MVLLGLLERERERLGQLQQLLLLTNPASHSLIPHLVHLLVLTGIASSLGSLTGAANRLAIIFYGVLIFRTIA